MVRGGVLTCEACVSKAAEGCPWRNQPHGPSRYTVMSSQPSQNLQGRSTTLWFHQPPLRTLLDLLHPQHPSVPCWPWPSTLSRTVANSGAIRLLTPLKPWGAVDMFDFREQQLGGRSSQLSRTLSSLHAGVTLPLPSSTPARHGASRKGFTPRGRCATLHAARIGRVAFRNPAGWPR